jgi:site-specific DNA recombinase
MLSGARRQRYSGGATNAALIDRHFGERAGRQLFSVADSIDTRTAVGRMILNIIMALAQCERETIVERTLGAMAFKRSRGERISGRLPYGQDLGPDGRPLVDNPAELEVLARIRALRDAGRRPGPIARELNRLAVPTKTGRGPWSPSTIRALLSRLA